MADGAVRIHTGTTVAPSIRWIAPTLDGTGHAYPRTGAGDAACGALRIDERFGYGIRIHCDDCLIVLGAEEVRLQAPGETMELWGK